MSELTYATPDDLVDDNRPYEPHGVLREAFHCREKEFMVSGPAGTGKSIALLSRLHYFAEEYPGFRALIVRKTKESLAESALFTFEEKVVPVGHPILWGPKRNTRQHYHYANGSEIVIGGLDKPSKVMSTEYDMIYVQEAIEILESDWETLSTRLRQFKTPYQQIMGDTNPDTPSHWINRRCLAGRCKMFESRHEDNPMLWSGRGWTQQGIDYLARLDALTGARKDRLRYGKWVQAEGVVYDEFDRNVHLIDRFDIPPLWPRYWAIDFGFTCPFVCLFAALDPDERLYVYREIYHTQRLVQDHAKKVLELARSEVSKEELLSNIRMHRPLAIVCDHDAEGRATFTRETGLQTLPARKDNKQESIQAVKARLRKQPDGRPRLYFLRDSVAEIDRSLLDSKHPFCTVDEFDGYIWARGSDEKNAKEVPVDRDDHGMDAVSYLVAHFDLKTKSKSPPQSLTPGVRNIGMMPTNHGGVRLPRLGG